MVGMVQNSSANCKYIYEAEIEDLGAMGTIQSAISSSSSVPLGLPLTTPLGQGDPADPFDYSLLGMISSGGALTTSGPPSAVLGLTGGLAMIPFNAKKKKEYRKISQLLDEALQGDGPLLVDYTNHLEKKFNTTLDKTDVASAINAINVGTTVKPPFELCESDIVGFDGIDKFMERDLMIVRIKSQATVKSGSDLDNYTDRFNAIYGFNLTTDEVSALIDELHADQPLLEKVEECQIDTPGYDCFDRALRAIHLLRIP